MSCFREVKQLKVIALLALLLVTAIPAFGQQPTTPPPAQDETAQAADPQTASEEIVVTARKREENVQEVPVAVTVVTSDKLEEAAATDISELQTQVPNLAVYQGRNQSTTLTAFLRGIGQADPLWGVDPGVGLYMDDVYMARPQGALLDVFDVERIEVLRGPQGTLYGKNTIGGAIKYVSKPLTDDAAGAVSLTLGEYNTRDLRVSYGGALVPGKVRGKIAFATLNRDGYGENLFSGREVSDRKTMALRGALDWLVTDTVKIAFSADYTKDDAEPKGYQRLAPNALCPVFGITCPVMDDRWDTQSGLAPLNGTESMGGSIVVSSPLGSAWEFKSITAYRESDSENNIDFDTTPARITDVQATYYDDQLTQELQLVYDGGGKLSGVLGAYYFAGEAGGLVKNIFVNAQFGTTNGRTLTDSIAVFGDGSYAITDKWTLNGGLRVTRETKNGIAFNAGYANDQFSTPVVILANYDKEATFNSVAPKIGVDYQVNPNVLVYFSASRGFKSGGFNVRAQSNAFPLSAEPFDDEILDVGALGLKSVLNEGLLVVNSEIFHGKYKDIQVSTFTAFDANGDGVEESFFGNFLNAGSATMNGLEIEFSQDFRNLNWLNINGFLSYLDLEPDEILDANRDGFVDTQVITNAPEWTGGLRFNFDFPLAGGLLTASVGGAYRGEAILTNEGGSFAGRPVLPISQDAYMLYDAWLSWLSPGATWRFGLNAKNVGDEAYLTNGYNIPALGILTGSYGAPRTVLATAEYRF
jgi:iron complex outermembrane recepter protein